jgi:hypothetical protein
MFIDLPLACELAAIDVRRSLARLPRREYSGAYDLRTVPTTTPREPRRVESGRCYARL